MSVFEDPEPEGVQIAIKGGNFTVITERVHTESRLKGIEIKKFPAYRGVIPKFQKKHEVIVDRADLLKAVQDVKSTLFSVSDGILMEISVKGIKISSYKSDKSESNPISLSNKIECLYHGKPIKIGFNPAYMIRTLKSAIQVNNDRVVLSVSEPTKPILINPVDSDLRFLVMPIRMK